MTASVPAVAATAAVEAVAAVAAVPATATAAAIPAVAEVAAKPAVIAVAAIPATGDELEAERVAEALAVAAKSKLPAPVTPVDAITGDPLVKPEGVPDKFWDAAKGEVNYAAWNKAHTELETKFHTDAGKTPEVIAAEKVIADAKAAAAPVGGGIVADAQAEYTKDGKLSDETYLKLAGVGANKATVDQWIVSATAQATEGSKLTEAAHEATEGKENYDKMLVWAEENLPEGEANAFNALVASPDAGVVKTAVEGLYKNFRENVTVEAERLGGSGAGSGANTFASKAEMTAAMNVMSISQPTKTRYETDPAYRVECQNKIKASRKAGINIFV